MHPRRSTLLLSTPVKGPDALALVVLTNQVLFGAQLVAIYHPRDTTELLKDVPCPGPQQIAFVDFFQANPDRHRRIGRVPAAAERTLGICSHHVPAIKTKILLELIDAAGRAAGDFVFDETWPTSRILDDVHRGRMSLVPLTLDLVDDQCYEKQSQAVGAGRFYYAITPYDQPLNILEFVPASAGDRAAQIHEVTHSTILASQLVG
jgi:hypothetical protein